MTTPLRFTQTSLFSPTQISGCTVWLDGADPNGNGTVPSNGSVVSTWVDKSSNGMTVSAASSQPTYSRNLQNGLGALTFDGTMNLTTGSILASKFAGNTVNLTMFCMVSFSNTVTGATYASPFCWANAGGVPRICLSVGNNADGVMMDVGANVIGRTTFAVPPPTFDNTFSFFSYFKNGVNTQLNLNGSNKAMTNNQDTTQFGGSTYAFNVGNGYANSSYFMRGSVGELLFYNSTLSTDNFQLVEGYLAWKWGLQGSLPSTHPYKAAPVYSVQPFPLVPRVPGFTNQAVFLPTQLSGCTLWLDAADTSTLTGSPITRWRDKSGLANNATATVGPTQSSYSGLPVVSFNGSTQFMDSPNTVPRTAHTLIAVHRPVTITANFQGNTSLFRYQSPGANYIVFPYMNGLTPRGYITSADGTGAGSIDFGNSTLVENSVTTAFNIIIAVISSGNQQIFKNGSLQSSDTENLSGATSDPLTIGRFPAGLSEYYQGDLGEMIVYSGVLNTTQRQQVEGYLAWKWGMVGTLPNGHPYKDPPLAPFSYAVRQATQRYWSPLTLPALTLWLDAADPATVALSGVNVTQWRDKSGVGNNATSVGTIPYTGTIGKLTAMTYPGPASTYFTGPLVNTGTTLSVFSVFLMNSSSYNTARILSLANTGSADFNNSLYVAAIERNGTLWNAFRSLTNLGGVTATFATPVQVCSRFDGTNHTFFLNGTQGSTVASSGAFGYSNFVVGSSSGEENLVPLNGLIGEMIHYTASVTTDQRQQVEGYLAWKWGLQGALPSSHPFKLFPPSPS
jgi:hypothetical protein